MTGAIKIWNRPGLVVHACNLSTSEGRGRRIASSRLVGATQEILVSNLPQDRDSFGFLSWSNYPPPVFPS